MPLSIDWDADVLGFTGTQEGMSDTQFAACQLYLVKAYERGCRRFAHGCCIGADEQAAKLAFSIGYWLHGFPAHELGHPKRASLLPNAIIEPIPAGPHVELTRNHNIVAVSTEILATPREQAEVRRSEAWATVRYAWAANLPTTILLR